MAILSIAMLVYPRVYPVPFSDTPILRISDIPAVRFRAPNCLRWPGGPAGLGERQRVGSFITVARVKISKEQD